MFVEKKLLVKSQQQLGEWYVSEFCERFVEMIFHLSIDEKFYSWFDFFRAKKFDLQEFTKKQGEFIQYSNSSLLLLADLLYGS